MGGYDQDNAIGKNSTLKPVDLLWTTHEYFRRIRGFDWFCDFCLGHDYSHCKVAEMENTAICFQAFGLHFSLGDFWRFQ